jgi:predicted metal-binding protein
VVYRGNPEAPLAQRERKLKAAAARRKEVNRVNQLTKSRSGSNILAGSFCPKTIEAVQEELMGKVSQRVTLDVDMAKLGRDLENYKEIALRSGASKATIVSISEIPVDERVTLKCQVPRCISYGVSAHCPPHTLKPKELRKMLKDYHKAIFFTKDLPTRIMEASEQAYKDLIAAYLDIYGIVSTVESQAFYDGYYLAVGFAAGSCRHTLCAGQNTCAALEGQSCRHYFRSRPSMEAVGINVFQMVAAAGWDIYPIGTDASLEAIPKGTMAGIVIVY